MTATDKEKDDAYRAVGRWFVEFSRLIFHMRLQVEQRLAKHELDPRIGTVAMRPAGPGAVNEAFFGMCHLLGNLDQGEKKIAEALQVNVDRAIRRRNEFAHGDWWVGFGAKADGSSGDPFLTRTRKGDTFWTTRDVPVGQLDALSNDLRTRTNYVTEFGEMCLAPERSEFIWGHSVRPKDVFVIDSENRVAREGPSSGERQVTFS